MSDTEMTSGLYFQSPAPTLPVTVRTELLHGPSGPHWLRADPKPPFSSVGISEEGLYVVDDGTHLLKLLCLSRSSHRSS